MGRAMVEAETRRRVFVFVVLSVGLGFLGPGCSPRNPCDFELLKANPFFLNIECHGDFSEEELAPSGQGTAFIKFSYTISNRGTEDIELTFPPERIDVTSSDSKWFYYIGESEWQVAGTAKNSSERITIKPGDKFSFEYNTARLWFQASRMKSFEFHTLVFEKGKKNDKPVTIGSILTNTVVWE